MSGLSWPWGDPDSDGTQTEPPARLWVQSICPCCAGRGWILETHEETPSES